MPVRVTLACGATARTLPMILGDVRRAGIDLPFLRMSPEEVFWRMTRRAEFDAAEMALSSYVWRPPRGDGAVMAIPAFPPASSGTRASGCAPMQIPTSQET